MTQFIKISILGLYFFGLGTTFTRAGDIELGRVNWLRSLKKGQELAKESGKPLLILFQEVPGCSTCKNYGIGPLSHPLLVEAIEQYFIPVCIHNNKNGPDKEALQLFQEPSWNNPVIRIVDKDFKDILGRLAGDYSAYGLVSKINSALVVRGIKIPGYLNLLEQEFRVNQFGSSQATFGMYCFWSGEKTFGKLDGVIATNVGYMGGSEVVTIQYDPSKIGLDELIKIGKSQNNADRLFTNENLKNNSIPIKKPSAFRQDAETKYYLYKSDYKYIPMTDMQATKLNAALGNGLKDDSMLSPKQIQYYNSIKDKDKSKLKNQIGKGIVDGW